jgi:hypothetical protein
MLINGDEFQVAKYDTFDACDVEAVKMIKENKDIFSVRCVLDDSAK